MHIPLLMLILLVELCILLLVISLVLIGYSKRQQRLLQRQHRHIEQQEKSLLASKEANIEDASHKAVTSKSQSRDEPRTTQAATTSAQIPTPQTPTQADATHTEPRATTNGDEELRLRNKAANQARQIQLLKKHLTEAQTLQEKAKLADILLQQLEHQLRLAQEADTCIQLLETELDQAHQEISRLSPQ